ncbi:STAS domain-containing protein [Sphaerisporangium perillae]|uniref:STAS domain-containing protein n=1 Tax=Sphaerisporangium perillae TaxID=2935860 RepID=UPI00200C86E6|nr:STAS domain-containing protein [Sphaerisporangium perillae]
MTVNVSTRTADGVTVARVEGEITSTTAPGVQDRLLPLVGGSGRLLIDFSAVPYVSSAGLRMLLILYRRAEQAQTGVVLGGLSEEVRFVMSATGFLGFFEIADDLGSEMGSVRP